MVKSPKILLGVTGSINIATIFVYISALQSELQCRMHIMMTPAAQSFIPASTLIHSIDGDVFVDLSAKGDFKMPHVELTHWADAIVVLPASANTIAKVAHGFAQDIVSSTILCANSPVIFLPSMYLGMWHKPSVKRNINQLREDGYHVYPALDATSTGNERMGGALPAPQTAASYVKQILTKSSD
ncbi:flavoprotein [Sulfoacidibacillus ferrooxidans]|uniref:Mersacidin decarboxylase n=1 Tax=Sulfoacidibacillus ferrooxidans TaxID=2005001 RepID=A0A9X1V652_9BACL|nr:Mersacidin decarboxylase [Sulfoacidibacillus ferrooxidans]